MKYKPISVHSLNTKNAINNPRASQSVPFISVLKCIFILHKTIDKPPPQIQYIVDYLLLFQQVLFQALFLKDLFL